MWTMIRLSAATFVYRSSVLGIYILSGAKRAPQSSLFLVRGQMPQYGVNTKLAEESQIARNNSQCKLARLRRENRKVRYGNEI
jgi:hypothetical protein